MTREESIEYARKIVKDWGDLNKSSIPAWTHHYAQFASQFLELAAPNWMDTPDGPGLYWIDCYGYCTLTTVTPECDGVRWAWTHGLKQPVDSFKGAKWAKAQLPIGPNRKKESVSE